MKSLSYITAALLLLFLGVGALYGGWNMISNPEGESLPLSLAWLDHTWFHDYPIAGITMMVVSGVLSLFTIAAMILELGNSAHLIFAQGFLLLGWTIVQQLLTRNLEPPHVFIGILGAFLIFLGWRIGQEEFLYENGRRRN